MAVCPLRYRLFSNNFFGKKTQRSLPKEWLVTWLYGIILLIFSTILFKIMIWEKIKEISWMADLEYFSSLNIWPGDRYHINSCKCFLDVICTFKFSYKNVIIRWCTLNFLQFTSTEKNFHHVIFYSWMKLFFFLSDLMMNPYNGTLPYHLLKHWHQFDLIF